MAVELEICDICDDDVAAVIALWQVCGLTRPWNDPAHDIAFARSQENASVLVGRERPDEAIVASVMVGHDGHRGWVYYLAVVPARQGAGLGAAMMDAAESWQLARGVWKLQLMVRAGNEAVFKFYGALDYAPSTTKMFEKWIDPSKRGDR